MTRQIGGYSVSQLRVVLDQQQRAKRQRIATLKSEISSRERELTKVIQELEELERAENLLED